MKSMNRKNANESDPLCLVCGGQSTHFCDGILGWPVVVTSDGPCTLLTITYAEAGTALPYTCDAPLCENCRESGKALSGPGGSDVTLDDLCPVCFAYGGGWQARGEHPAPQGFARHFEAVIGRQMFRRQRGPKALVGLARIVVAHQLENLLASLVIGSVRSAADVAMHESLAPARFACR